METTKAYVGKQRLQRMLQAVGHAEIVRIYQVSYQALSSRLETLKAQSKQRQSQRLRASARPSSGDGFRIARSLSRSLSPSLAFSLSRSLAPSLPRSLAPSCVHAFYLSRTLCLSRSLSLSLSLSLDRTFACSLCGPLPKPLFFSLFCLLLAFFLSRSLALSLSRSLALRSLSEALAVDGLGAKASGAYIQTRARAYSHTHKHMQPHACNRMRSGSWTSTEGGEGLGRHVNRHRAAAQSRAARGLGNLLCRHPHARGHRHCTRMRSRRAKGGARERAARGGEYTRVRVRAQRTAL